MTQKHQSPSELLKQDELRRWEESQRRDRRLWELAEGKPSRGYDSEGRSRGWEDMY